MHPKQQLSVVEAAEMKKRKVLRPNVYGLMTKRINHVGDDVRIPCSNQSAQANFLFRAPILVNFDFWLLRSGVATCAGAPNYLAHIRQLTGDSHAVTTYIPSSV